MGGDLRMAGRAAGIGWTLEVGGQSAVLRMASRARDSFVANEICLVRMRLSRVASRASLIDKMLRPRRPEH